MQRSGGGRNIKPREDRRRTVLPAQVRNGAGWADACILNISSRGLLIHARCPAQLGSQIKLRRGHYLLVGRVIWRSRERIGVWSHSPLPVDDLISSHAASADVPAITGAIEIERPARPRSPGQSRAVSRVVEFLSLVLVAAALAGGAAVYAYETLSKPLDAVHRALEPN